MRPRPRFVTFEYWYSLLFITCVRVEQLLRFLFCLADNAAIHHVAEIRQIIEGHGCILEFLPPYSPDLNPIEELFSKVKGWLASNDIVFKSSDEPEVIIQEAFLQITPNDCFGYFEHGQYT